MTDILVEQQAHGYRSGHQLLSASLKLSRDDQDVVDRLSDIAGPLRPGETFGPYITTYPLPSEAYYVVARTWQDTAAPRAGCVRTHSLLIPMGVWETFRYVGSLVSLLTPIDEGGANVPLRVPAVESVFASVRDDRIFELVEALFLESRQPIVMFDAPEAETMTLRLLTALWPGRRRSLAACTWSLGPRKLMGRDFDIVFSLRYARSRFSDWTGRRIEPSTRAVSPRHRWSAELADAIFLSDTPMLSAWDELGILKADQLGDEGALRLSLLWRELEGKARTTPDAVLGMLDILNSQNVGAAASKAKLAPLVIHSVNFAATRENPSAAWRFLVTLLGKFPDRLPISSVLRKIRRASTALAARHLAASIDFLDEMDAQERELPAVIAAGLGDGVASADLNDATAKRFATIEPMSTLRLLAFSRRFARWLCSAIGQDPSAWIDCLLKSLERPDADLLRRARRHVAPYLNNAALAPAVEPLMRGVTPAELGAAVAAVGKRTGFTVEAFDSPFIAAARDQESIGALRRAILDVEEGPSSNRFLLRTLRLGPSDITWLCNSSGMERRRVTNLLLGLLDRSDDFAIQAVQRDAPVADLMLQTLLEDQVRAADQVARILLVGQFRADRLIEAGLRVYPHVQEDNRRRLALTFLSRGLAELEDHPPVSLHQLIRQAIPYIDGRQLIVLATQPSASPSRIAENLAALDRSDAPVRAMIAGLADELTERLVSRPFEDRRETAYVHWASLIEASGPVADDTHLRAAISALSFALRRPQLPLSALVVVSFPTVYRQLLMSKGESDFASLPSLLLLPLTFFMDWDRAKVARRELVEAFVQSKWPPVNLIIAALNAGIEQQVLRRVSRQRQGDRYIERIWNDSSRLNAALQARIRDAVTDFRRGVHKDWD